MRVGQRIFGPDDVAVVGILNITPDSFSDGGMLPDVAAVVRRGKALVAAGADILDIGGESTRPGASPTPPEAELARVLPAIAALHAEVNVPLSVDTRRAAIAAAALDAGASMINDVSGFGDPAMAHAVASHDAAWVLMHMPHDVGRMGASERVHKMPKGVAGGLRFVADALAERVAAAQAAGVPRQRLAVDPGIGFGKSVRQNAALCGAVEELAALGLPLYLGPSRKSFIGALTDRPTGERVMGTAAAVTACVLARARFVRVHDVAAMVDVVRVALAIRDARGASRPRDAEGAAPCSSRPGISKD